MIQEKSRFYTPKKLKQAMKCIGKTIIHDADFITPPPERTKCIRITAEITPNELTTVKYDIERYSLYYWETIGEKL